MRIAVYHNLSSGGAKRALGEMIRMLGPKHEIDAYTLSCAEHNFADLRPHVRQHHVTPFEPSRLLASPLGRANQYLRTRDLHRLETVNREIAGRIDQGGYDLVFVHNCQFTQSPSLLSALKTPTVYFCQEPLRIIYEPAPRKIGREGFRRALDRIDPLPRIYRSRLTRIDRDSALAAGMVLVNSHYSRESFYRAYGRFGVVCYLGVNTELFHPTKQPPEPMVLSVGHLSPRKGFDFLIRSLRFIEKPRRPKLVIACNAAEPAERACLNELAARHGVDVEIRQMVSDVELVRLYNSALMTVYAPIMEPFGFVPLESMACGTPVVGVREAGVRETIADGETGLLVSRDEREFAAAVGRIIGDRPYRESLGRQGRVVVERQWRWEATAGRLDTAFTSLLERNREEEA